MSFAKLWSKTPVLMDFTDNSTVCDISFELNPEHEAAEQRCEAARFYGCIFFWVLDFPRFFYFWRWLCSASAMFWQKLAALGLWAGAGDPGHCGAASGLSLDF